ncbi:hypothetical protein C2E21_2742 [Chlorella sorokiniana]|uniref:GATA-type domain-containing protein n=1 Tax=Chlorella sorokiniana TaxID=3076 RepID=A0A2P6TXC4_CHLSO|nr:hypothetical protein C2E21_2742 [Chlorella sorokiniana]|eukprot:PRW58714.1 hypothetical protein C2E21_2742 [Chlorella sorokiniana]
MTTSSTVYAGGAAAGVACFSCAAIATTGSWRPGWRLPDGASHANLCNRCGQRWTKAGRPGSLAELRAAEERKARTAGAGASAAAPHAGGSARPSGAKRPADAPVPPAQAVAAAAAAKRARLPLASLAALTPPRRPRRALTEEDDSSGSQQQTSSSTETLTPSQHHGRTASVQSPLGAGAAAAPAAAGRPTQTATAAAPAPKQGPTGAPVTASGQRFVSYCVQKLSSGKANHSAFWIQDAAGESLLAVVGTDARLSGHFTYSTTPAFMELRLAPALRCTNRSEVQAWLAGWGMTNGVSDGAVKLPELSSEEKKRLLNPEEPVWARPAGFDARAWTGVREESGRLTDGRHFKRFWLRGGGGRERLVVSGVDSIRKDRRYKYLAEEDMGGFTFENAREVMCWVNFVLQRPASALLEAEQTRAARPLKEDELGSLLPRLKAAAQQERMPPPPAPTRPRQLIGRPGDGSSGAAGGEGGKAGGGSPYATGLGGKVRPLASYQLVTRGRQGTDELPSPAGRSSGGKLAGNHQQQQQQEGPVVEPMEVDASASHGELIETGAALPLPRLGCACCGLSEHATEQCPLVMISPPSLVYAPAGASRRTLSLLLDPKPLSNSASPEEHRWEVPDEPSPQLLSREQLLRCAGGSLGGGEGLAGGAGSGNNASAAPARAGAPAAAAAAAPAGGTDSQSASKQEALAASGRVIGKDLQAAFQRYPQLLAFATRSPSAAAAQQFEGWAEKLESHISDLPPPLPTGDLDTPVGGWRWTSTAEALRILQQLSSARVSLALLESTGVCRAVAQLRTHSNRDVASAAEGIVQRWRTCAVATLEQATAGLARR